MDLLLFSIGEKSKKEKNNCQIVYLQRLKEHTRVRRKKRGRMKRKRGRGRRGKWEWRKKTNAENYL